MNKILNSSHRITEEKSDRLPEEVSEKSLIENSTLLLIDDSDVERTNIAKILKQESIFTEIYEARDGLEGFRILIDRKPDIVICDMIMPQYDGIAFLKMLGAESERKLVLPPVLMLTGVNNLSSKVQGFRMGASDYIIKPIDPTELLARVQVHLKLKKLQEHLLRQKEQLEKQNETLRHLSITDPLTGLYNRRFLLQRYEEEFVGSIRYHSPLSIVLFDIDFFKRINDTHGHQAGDEVLRFFAKTMVSNLRKRDFAGRYGGEEFMIVLPHTEGQGAVRLAERVRQECKKVRIHFENREFSITVSGGVASFPDLLCNTPWELVRASDQALYEAKNRGRDRIITIPG